MAVYVVTGNLGGGKSLMSVHRIETYLREGRPVATNLDIRLFNMLPRSNKTARLVRVPDKPCLDDFLILGKGNHTYDEEKNGLIVLDECGTWFNSRSWGDKSRQSMIDWLLHSRKEGWDVIFIVQNISLIDKQARLALGEHVVYCRRTDRLNIPLIGSFFKLFWGGKLPLPRFHLGVVKYGLLPTSLTVDTWACRGNRLFQAYDTKQRFTESYPHGPHSILPPWYTHHKYKMKKSWRNYMRLTKIYFRQWSRLASFGAGGVVMFFLLLFFQSDNPVIASTELSSSQNSVSVEEKVITGPETESATLVSEQDAEPVLYKVDYLQHNDRLLISFDGMRYNQFDFPYKLLWRSGDLYALLPPSIATEQSDKRRMRRGTGETRSVAAVTDAANEG